jgi:hypothetical protein
VGPDVEGAQVVAWAGGAPPPPDLGRKAGRTLVVEVHEAGCRAGPDVARARGADDAPPAVALAWGALLADAVQRRLVGAPAPQASFTVTRGGGVA